jgi:Helicase HerA, central domain
MESPPGRRTEEPALVRIGSRYRAPLLVRELPGEVPFGFLERVLPTTEPVELRIELHRVPPDQALAMVERARQAVEVELSDSGSGAESSRLEVERMSSRELGLGLARRSQELWKVGMAFVALSSGRVRVESVRARLADRLAGLGFRTRVPRYEVGSALRAALSEVAAPRPRGYWHTLPSDGVASLFPYGDETVLEPGGILVGLALADASPVFLDRWSHSSHSWGLFGTTGSGKSFAAALFALRSRWLRPDLDLLVLDPLGEFGGLVRALGGEVLRLADPGVRRLNPLDPVTTGGDRREKAARVVAMLRALFPSLRDDEAARLDASVTRLYDRGPTVPTLDDLLVEVERDTVDDTRLRSLLEVFRTGSLRDVNGPTTFRTDASPLSIDLSGISQEHRAFHLTYLLDWAYGRLRDRPGPKLVLVDEAHLLATHAPTAEFLDRVVRHIRHFGAGLLLLSQNPDDFLATPSGRSTLRNLHATAFLHLPEVSRETRAFFGLTEAEAAWLPRARLPTVAGYSESLWRIAELHLPLAIVASSPEYEFLRRALGVSTPPAGREDGL